MFGGPIGPQGAMFELLRGANVGAPGNFITGIDRFTRSTGRAVSMKTIDVAASTYERGSSFRRLVRGYVDKLNKYPGDLAGVVEEGFRHPGSVRSRVLEIGVVGNRLTRVQERILLEEATRGERLAKPVSLRVFRLFRR